MGILDIWEKITGIQDIKTRDSRISKMKVGGTNPWI